MLIAVRTIWTEIRLELLCGIRCGVMAFLLLHLVCPGYVGGYYQSRQYANYLCVWLPGDEVLLASVSGVEGIWIGFLLTLFAVLVQWLADIRRPNNQALPLFAVVTGYLALVGFACCQVVYDMRAWKVHPQFG